MKLKLISIIAVGALLAACDTYTPQQYQSSPQNVIALQGVAASGKRASVGHVTVAEGVVTRPTCRLAGPLDLGGGLDVATVVKQALQSEFLEGGVFSTRGTPINVLITKMDPDSFSGTWTLGLQVSSRKSAGYQVSTVHDFSTSFTAVAACNNTADAFNRALAKAINELVANPQFRKLL